MKATGIVRRIDDLGRVVIPKEIRRTLRIREGDPLEIFTDHDGQVILKKYSPIGELGTFAKEYAEALAQTTGLITCIADKDQIIAVSGGSKKEFLDKSISQSLEKVIEERTVFTASKDDEKFIPILADETATNYTSELISPIIAEGDVVGAVIFLSSDKNTQMGEVETKLAQSAAGFLGKQMEQ
ncbi:MAG: stage V sporulation protein T [Epulopiscium sp.]|nr:stage V sporulation protein T [Candidatus Epulonipiscium sp.]